MEGVRVIAMLLEVWVDGYIRMESNELNECKAVVAALSGAASAVYIV